MKDGMQLQWHCDILHTIFHHEVEPISVCDEYYLMGVVMYAQHGAFVQYFISQRVLVILTDNFHQPYIFWINRNRKI